MPIWIDKVQRQNCLPGKFQKQVWSSVLKYHSLFCPHSQAVQAFLIYLIFSQSSWNFYLHNLYIDKKCCCHFMSIPGTPPQKTHCKDLGGSNREEFPKMLLILPTYFTHKKNTTLNMVLVVITISFAISVLLHFLHLIDLEKLFLGKCCYLCFLFLSYNTWIFSD